MALAVLYQLPGESCGFPSTVATDLLLTVVGSRKVHVAITILPQTGRELINRCII